jgi:hypothetical protein
MKPLWNLEKIIRLLLASSLFFLISCANKSTTRLEHFSKPLKSGEFDQAIAMIQKDSDDLYGERNNFLYNMDLGVLFHYTYEYDSSLIYLKKAEELLEGLYAKSVTNEAASVVTNDNIRPYRSRPYEIVMMHQYLVFNYLALDQIENARIQCRRGLLYLETLEDEEDKYNDEGMFHYINALIFEQLGEEDNTAISLYKSAKAYRNGKIALPKQVEGMAFDYFTRTEREKDIEELRLKKNEFSDYSAERSKNPEELIVISHAGRSPLIAELSFWGTYVRDGLLIYSYKDANGRVVSQTLPAPGLPASELNKVSSGSKNRSGSTFHISFTLPEFKASTSQTSTIEVRADKKNYKSSTVTDLNQLLKQQLDDDRLTTLTRTVIRVALRTMAAQKTKDAMQTSDPLVNLLLNIGTDVLADQLEMSDIRLCFWLPRYIQVTRIPLEPGIHRVEVVARDSMNRPLKEDVFSQVKVRKGKKSFLFNVSSQ